MILLATPIQVNKRHIKLRVRITIVIVRAIASCQAVSEMSPTRRFRLRQDVTKVTRSSGFNYNKINLSRLRSFCCLPRLRATFRYRKHTETYPQFG